MDIYQTLKDDFSFDSFLPGQEEVIRRLLAGNSTLAIFPTGQGKSLCYQLTAQHLDGMTLVVSPLMALMKDQVDGLQKRGIKAARIDSSLSAEEYKNVRDALTAGRLKLLYVAPERFGNERFLADLQRVHIAMLVVDEAHCISEWGHNFRPDYLKIAETARFFNVPLSLCLTATATPEVAKDICRSFTIADENFIKTGFYRSNLTLRFSPSSPSDDSFNLLLGHLHDRQPGATIVYVTLQATAEKVAEKLEKHGFAVRPYHAGLQDEVRKEIQEWFMASDTGIVVATIAFGMGIDKGNIRYVYHYNLPKSLENYSQETGRAGRDGRQAVCVLAGNAHDLIVLENFSYGDTPDTRAIRDMYTMISEQPDTFSISVSKLAYEYDMRPLVVNTFLTYLELEKIIAATGPFYTSYKFIPHTSSAEMFSHFDQQRAAFLQAMFSCSRKNTKWFYLDLDEVVTKTKSPRERIISALNFLEEQGYLKLQVTGIRKGYRKIKKLSVRENEKIISTLQEKFLHREKRDIERLQRVVELLEHDGCKVRFLLSYFGEELPEDCGHCEYCLGAGNEKRAFMVNRPEALEIPAEDERTVMELFAEMADDPALASARQRARFLCGLNSPKTSRANLTRHAYFGILADHSFGLVLKWLEGQDESKTA